MVCCSQKEKKPKEAQEAHVRLVPFVVSLFPWRVSF
jgi:hypothetical protein